MAYRQTNLGLFTTELSQVSSYLKHSEFQISRSRSVSKSSQGKYLHPFIFQTWAEAGLANKAIIPFVQFPFNFPLWVPFDIETESSVGKIALHLLFGWSLDKDKKSLDQSKQFSWKFGSIQIKAVPNPDHPPLGIFWTYHFFCTKHKIIENEKWKLLETLQYTIKEFNNGNVVCSTMHCPNGSRWGGDVKRVARILCIV